MEGQTQGKQKVQNKWTTIECKEDCQYRIKTGQAKPMCNEEGILKFMLPDICTDKIWYMRIKSKTSRETIRDYINFQKQVGNSLIGDYVIFLKEVEHTVEGKKYKNKVLDIIKKEDFVSNNQILSSNQTLPQNQTQLSTNESKNVNNSTENQKNTVSKTDNAQNNKTTIKEETIVEKTTQNVETTEKKTTKKTSKAKKEEQKEKSNTTEIQEDMSSKYEKCHTLISTEQKILTKDGKPTEYLFANFADTQDKTYQVIIPPQFAEELKQCDLGTVVILDLQTKGDKTFTNSIEYIHKCIKSVAA